MRTTFRRAAIACGALLLVLLVVFLLNQAAQLVALADRVSPLLGTAVLWVLAGVYGVFLTLPIFLFIRLPKALVHPDPGDARSIAKYREALGRRLRRNPHLEGHPIESEKDIGEALAILNRKADEATRRSAAQVFLTTAISQNGSLDAIIVLIVQSRLIFEIARIYSQRSGLHELVWLYTNVAGTAFIASGIEEIDISEQVQPLVSSVAGSAISAIPGFQTGTAVIVNSVMSGGANAFLTLRVGMIAKQYCASIEKPPKKLVRRSAAVQAARMLSGIMAEGTRSISKAMISASTRPMRDAVSRINETIRASASAATGLIRRGKEEPGEPNDVVPR